MKTAWIGTYSGKRFSPCEPRGEDIAIEDIAHSLAYQCRFNGHCHRFYSVAEHSVELSRWVPGSAALWGLLHDAAEAYLSDIVRPIKGRLYVDCGWPKQEPICDTECRLLRLIAEQVGLAWPPPPCIEGADLRMLKTERLQLFDARQPHWGALDGVDPYRVVLQCLDPAAAERQYLMRFRELVGGG